MELSLPGANIQWNFRSRERKFHGTFVPWNEITLELSLPKWEKLQLTRICKRMTSRSKHSCRSVDDGTVSQSTQPPPQTPLRLEGDTPSPHPTPVSAFGASTPHSHLTPLLQRTQANIRIKLALLETRIPGLHFCR